MPDWDRITKQQQRAWDAMYDPMEVAERNREVQERTEKKKVKKHLRELLKEDKEFRAEVIRLLKG